MRRQFLEMLIGAGVVVAAAVFMVIVYSSKTVKQAGEYELVARFLEVGSLVEGDPVRVSGIRVGNVVKKEVDPQSFDVVLIFTVTSDVKLPVDSRAMVTGESLGGGKYLQLVPGSSEAMLQPGEEVRDTKNVIDVESLVGELIKLAVGADEE
ncbi:MAG: MlaD family protein [Kiloniellales bacterium]